MSENKLVLKTVNNLLEENFYIPSYQRGYRWSKFQVKQLLKDIWEFSDKKKSNKEFYCLQPIVLRPYKWKNNEQSFEGWEVIDGQQRLTTLRILLSYLVNAHLKRSLKEAYKKSEFSIQYETRPKSEAFLNNLNKDYSNIDFYYISSAYEAISDWFNDKDFSECNKFLSTLLAKDNSDHPVKVIWYEINEEINAINIFTRLNIGKIPLTNAELIKALFLSKASSNNQNVKISSKQLQIASEWNEIENVLQNSSFWYFIYDKENLNLPKDLYDTRIEFIFDLMKNKPKGEEKYFTFYKFLEEEFQSEKTIDVIWLDVKRYFLKFKEWYNDRELYHLIGFLITTGFDLKEIIKESNNQTKIRFKNYLKKEIGKKINIDFEDLDYGKKSIVKQVLLLFNIHTMLANEKSNSRFPFENYKNNEWDLEHIRSQTEVELKGSDRENWAKLVLEFYSGKTVDDDRLDEQIVEIEKLNKHEKEICIKLISLIKSEYNEEEWNGLYKEISEIFKEDNPPETDNIANLTLLDAGTNRAYKNAFFPIKRMEIIKREKEGSFVPLCTKNVFMKAYSKRFDKVMYWGQNDANDYYRSLTECLEFYKQKIKDNG